MGDLIKGKFGRCNEDDHRLDVNPYIPGIWSAFHSINEIAPVPLPERCEKCGAVNEWITISKGEVYVAAWACKKCHEAEKRKNVVVLKPRRSDHGTAEE